MNKALKKMITQVLFLIKLLYTMYNYCFVVVPSNRCLNQCSYCKTKHARGELGSYPPDEIVARAKQAFTGWCSALNWAVLLIG